MTAQFIPSPWELHPPLVHFPIAFLLAGVAVDLFAWWCQRAQAPPADTGPAPLALIRFATGLLIAGVLGGVLASLTGFVAYVTAPLYVANADILMNWHLGLALASLTLFVWVAFVRWLDWASAPSFLTRVTGLAAAVLLVAGAALGGHLVYRAGAGFDPGLFGPAADRPARPDARSGTGRPPDSAGVNGDSPLRRPPALDEEGRGRPALPYWRAGGFRFSGGCGHRWTT